MMFDRLVRGSIMTPVSGSTSETISLLKVSNQTLLFSVRTWWSTPSPPIAGITAGTFGCLFAFKAMVVAVSNHSGWDPGRAFWRSLRHHETAPTRFDIVVDFDGRGNAGDVTTGILLADDDQG